MRIAILFMLCIILVSCKKEDTQSPVLELLGSDTVVQWLPSTAGSGYYFDAGVTARDNEDGNITANVLVENLVNPNRKGTYTVTYSISNGVCSIVTTADVTINPLPATSPIWHN